MEQEYRDDGIEWPPRDIDEVIWPAAWEYMFRVTKEAAKAQYPDRVADIELLDDDCMCLQMVAADDGAGPLCLLHGVMVIDKEKETRDLLLLKEADTARILNSLPPPLRIEIAREIVWQYIMDTIKEEDDAACADLVDDDATYNEECDVPLESAEDEEEDESNQDFESSLPEINAYHRQGGDLVGNQEDYDNEDNPGEEEHDVDTEDFDINEILDKDGMDSPEEDPAYIEFANKDPALRALYVQLVQGRFHYVEE